MAYPGSTLHRALTDKQEHEFRQYAQEHDPPSLKSWSMYHPVCREEWERRGVAPVMPFVLLDHLGHLLAVEARGMSGAEPVTGKTGVRLESIQLRCQECKLEVVNLPLQDAKS